MSHQCLNERPYLAADATHLGRLSKRGQQAEALAAVERLQALMSPDQTVTTTEAAELLGIRSINTVKALLRAEGIPTTRNGNRIMIPLAEILKLKDSRQVQHIRASDRAHDASPGRDEPMSDEAMEVLQESRPGTLPWERV